MLIRTSLAAGATPTVPCIGSSGRSSESSDRRAWNRQVPASRSISYIHTRSSRAGWSIAVACVVVSAPKCGNVLDAAQSRAGTISTKWTARVSPGSAPSTAMGPVTGLRKGKVHTWLGRSSTPRTLPAKQSSVDSSTMVPGATVSSGSRPPNA